MARAAKRGAYRFGRLAETLCCWRLLLAGYRIEEQGYRAATGEIDIIARRGRTIAFIEVKARRTEEEAETALQPRQRRRIERTAMVYLSRHPEGAALDARFDLMTVAPWRWPRHRPAAWMAGE